MIRDSRDIRYVRRRVPCPHCGKNVHIVVKVDAWIHDVSNIKEVYIEGHAKEVEHD